MSIKKIGILCDERLDFFEYNLFKEIMNIKNIELLFIVCDPQKNRNSFTKKAADFILRCEHKILSYFFEELKPFLKSYDISELSKTPATLRKVSDIDLLLILNPAVSLDKKTIDTPKDGIVRVFFNKYRHIQKYPIAFWEIYERKSSIGFCIEHISKNINRVLLNANLTTQRTITQTRIRVQKESSFYIKKILSDYAKKEFFEKKDDPKVFSLMQQESPKLFHLIGYILKTCVLFTDVAFKRLVLKKYTRFSVAFLKSDWQDAKLYEAKEIKPPPFHFYADPFVWTRDNKTVCFVEDYDYKQNSACISAVEIYEDDSYKIVGEVIKEPFHLSFPFLFEYEKDLYMIVESSADKSIRLYKCINFPTKWRFEKYLMQNVKTADTMVFEHENRWWMLTNMSTPSNDDQAAALFAFYSDSPLSQKWTPHEKNPVVFDSDCGRNAGLLFSENKEIFRVRQRQKFNIYGAAFSIAKILKLSPKDYEEKEISSIQPDFFLKLKATHHMHSNNDITVVDFMRLLRLNP